MHINNRIKEIREKRGYTKKNTADFLNVEQDMISKIENGEQPSTLNMLNSLSELFGVPMSSFSNDTTISPINFAMQTSDLTSNDLRAIAAINRIAMNSEFMNNMLTESKMS